MRKDLTLWIATIVISVFSTLGGLKNAYGTTLPKECDHINFRYVEFIESQGAFGLSTPKADARTLRKAMLNTTESDAIVEAELESLASTGFASGSSKNYSSLTKGKSFIPELCFYLNKKKITNITFACNADTSSSPQIPSSITSDFSEFFTKCVISKSLPNDAGWDDYLASSWGVPGTSSDLIPDSGDEDRYDVIKNKERRENAYYNSLRETVQNFLLHEVKDRSLWELDYKKTAIPKSKTVAPKTENTSPATKAVVCESSQENTNPVPKDTAEWIENCLSPLEIDAAQKPELEFKILKTEKPSAPTNKKD